MENEVERIDVVKAEHDLICWAIECLHIDSLSSQRPHYDEKFALGYIAGVSDMVKKLDELIECRNDEEEE